MNLGDPLLDVVPSVRGALLRELVRLEQPVTRRQLADAAGVAPGNASGVIEELIRTGLVSETIAGRASMVALNRNHLEAGPIMALAALRAELIHRIEDRLAEWPELMEAWLFGSVARGDADATSDIDVLIVATDLDSADLHERIAALHTDVRSWTGNDLQLVEHTPVSWQQLVDSHNPSAAAIQLEGIRLAGRNTPG